MGHELDDVLAANAEYQKTEFHEAPRTPQPSRHLVILTCMDARLDLFRALGLDVGEAHILRNAGGRASPDALRSLIVSTRLLNTREIGVIHHTNCGLEGFTNDEVATKTGVDGVDFLAFPSAERSVADDVEVIRNSPHLPDDIVVWGGVYDVDNGELRIITTP